MRCCVGGIGLLVTWGHGLRAPHGRVRILHVRKQAERVHSLLVDDAGPLM
jgi:hypothetical protein